jgi:hypothetical protein
MAELIFIWLDINLLQIFLPGLNENNKSLVFFAQFYLYFSLNN